MTFKLMALAVALLLGGYTGVRWVRSPVDPIAVAELGTSSQQTNSKKVYNPTVSAMHGGADAAPTKPVDEVIVPELSPVAQQGKLDFDSSSSTCHGINAAGTEKGPPLIHSLYRPGHHPDPAFASAVVNGVTAHHWRFGNMPPMPGGVSNAELRWIVKYVREMQVANGVR
jgi:mono/diheme cytochrome c family protein